MTPIERILALREGGQTLRVHTIPHVREYNVAVHSYNMVNMLFVLYPGIPSYSLIQAIMWHDTAERWTGDVPAPAKWASDELKSTLGELEDRILAKLELDLPFKLLEAKEKIWLKALDMLELYVWAIEQTEMGNKAAALLKTRALANFKSNWSQLPKEIRIFIDRFNWKRSPECDELLEE